MSHRVERKASTAHHTASVAYAAAGSGGVPATTEPAGARPTDR